MWNLIVSLGVCAIPVALALIIRPYWIAVLLSAAALTVLIHLGSYFGSGYVDPFFVISIPLSVVAFIGWSALVIWTTRRFRKLAPDSKVDR